MRSIAQELARWQNQHALKAAQIVAGAQRVIGDRARVISIRNGVLLVEADTPAQGANLLQLRDDWIRQIRSSLTGQAVRKIVIRAGPAGPK